MNLMYYFRKGRKQKYTENLSVQPKLVKMDLVAFVSTCQSNSWYVGKVAKI